MKVQRTARPRSTRFAASDWIDVYMRDLVSYCRQLTGSQWDADDLAHDVILKVAESLDGRPLVHANPRGYLFRVARNAWIDELRKHRLLDLDAAMEVVAPARTDSLEVEEAFSTLLIRLTPLQRAVLLLRDVYGYSAVETADLLGTTVGAVKASLHRARQALRREPPPGTGAMETLPDEQVQLVQAYAALFRQHDIDGLVTLALCDVLDPVVAVSSLFHRRGQQESVGRRHAATHTVSLVA